MPAARARYFQKAHAGLCAKMAPPFQTNAMGSRQGWFAPGPRLRAFELRGETEQRAVATHAGNELHAYR